MIVNLLYLNIALGSLNFLRLICNLLNDYKNQNYGKYGQPELREVSCNVSDIIYYYVLCNVFKR